ncbi:MAG TPA: hypothetical protein VFF47_05420 [Nitrospirota bacterium]|nr:hypothetical protein [Nitrospirota bacterium]
MENDLIKRSIRTSVIVAVILIPFLYLYLGSTFTYGFIAGAAWNIVNVFLLFHLITNLITPAESNKGLGVIAGVIKFPLLYGAGYIVIRYTDVSLYGILAGFSLILLIFALKALGIFYTNVIGLKSRSYGKST